MTFYQNDLYPKNQPSNKKVVKVKQQGNKRPEVTKITIMSTSRITPKEHSLFSKKKTTKVLRKKKN